MAHSTIILDKRSQKKDGTYPLKIRVSHIGEFYINLNVDLLEEQWSPLTKIKSGTIVNHPLAKRLNTFIISRKNTIDKKLLDLSDSRKISKLNNKQLKDILTSDDSISEHPLFADHCKKFILQKEKPSTRESYQLLFNKIAKYNDMTTLTFKDINIAWLKEFESQLKAEELAINSIAIMFRSLRAVINDAINDDVIGQDLYPFRKFKIKQEKTIKRSLSIEQLRILKDYPCEKHQDKYRDIFMLIFYLIGINIVDLLHLTEIVNGRVVFKRAKTGRIYSIGVSPEAMAIIEKYKGDEYLIYVLDDYVNYKDFANRMNRNLRLIGNVEMVANNAKTPKDVKKNKKQRTALFPNLTTYWARHTWATIAASLDIPKETIAAALGHGGNSVTDIYINFDQRKVDAANRQVIDYLHKKEVN